VETLAAMNKKHDFDDTCFSDKINPGRFFFESESQLQGRAGPDGQPETH